MEATLTDASEVRIESDDVNLNVAIWGTGPPLLLLHGLMGSSASWLEVVPSLSRDHTCICLDLPGHGKSDVPPSWQRYTVEKQMTDVARALDHLEVDRTAILGYSMGGRIALSFALSRPERVSSLICESTSPGIEDELERKQRMARDESLSQSIETEGMEAFVSQWETLPLFGTQIGLREAVRRRLRQQRLNTSPVGAAGSLRGMSTGRFPQMWTSLSRLRIPVLLIGGEQDHTYMPIIKRIHKGLPSSVVALVPGAGHNVHLEQPNEFTNVVADFLRRYGHTEIVGADAGDRVAIQA